MVQQTGIFFGYLPCFEADVLTVFSGCGAREVDFDWAMSAARKKLPPKKGFRGAQRIQRVKALAKELRKQKRAQAVSEREETKRSTYKELNNYSAARKHFDAMGGIDSFGFEGYAYSAFYDTKQVPIDALSRTPTWFMDSAFEHITSFSCTPNQEKIGERYIESQLKDIESYGKRLKDTYELQEILGMKPARIQWGEKEKEREKKQAYDNSRFVLGMYDKKTEKLTTMTNRHSILHETAHAYVNSNYDGFKEHYGDTIFVEEGMTGISMYTHGADWEEGLAEAFAFFFHTKESNEFLRLDTPKTWKLIQDLVVEEGE